MKLAQALLLRADLKQRQVSLREPIARNAWCKKGSVEIAGGGIAGKSAFGAAGAAALVRCINKVNKASKLGDDRVRADVMAERERWVEYHALLVSTIAATHKDVDGYSQREIQWMPQV